MNEEMINNEAVEAVAEAGKGVGKKVAIVGVVILTATGLVALGRKAYKAVKAKKEQKRVEAAKEVKEENVVVVEEDKTEE